MERVDVVEAANAMERIGVFKVLGNQTTCVEYANAHGGAQESDWSAFYMQLNAAHAVGTVAYRWDQGYVSCNMLRVGLAKRRVYAVPHDWMADGAVAGAEKGRRVKAMFGLAPELPLMQQLDGYLLCKETDDEWELIVPHHMLASSIVSESVVASFRCNTARNCTSHARMGDGSDWLPFDGGKAAVAEWFGPNAAPPWIAEFI